jgi:outer membrane protein OmpA-like peptidoglycan-associated protein
MMKRIYQPNGLFASLIVIFALNADALAQQSNFRSSEDIVRALEKSEVSQQSPLGTRGALTRNPIPRSRSIDLTINFEFDSERVVMDSKPQLEALRVALQNPKLAKERFAVEGHTDAKGTESYNLRLSQRRALAIVQFLKDSGVSEDRLSWEGKGFSDLKDQNNPESAVNRRVRVKAFD